MFDREQKCFHVDTKNSTICKAATAVASTSSQCKLCVLGHRIALVQNDHLVLLPAHRPRSPIMYISIELALSAVCEGHPMSKSKICAHEPGAGEVDGCWGRGGGGGRAHPNKVRLLAKSWTCCLTTPIPRSSDAFSSSTMLPNDFPYSCRATCAHASPSRVHLSARQVQGRPHNRRSCASLLPQRPQTDFPPFAWPTTLSFTIAIIVRHIRDMTQKQLVVQVSSLLPYC